ncbi:thiamine/thiamine pyrophosphate ABC transporter permease ThiP [Paracoccus aestuarii]|uniref:Thiamine/thiamine pyrophosphate ABC transporter permease ThiP n=1 Tax=Paracoccus aestuarii TaxID=453842 RepID=A0A418ZWR4_9RHOB|nr:thiamine/thiamine pyrophosphate ABC transporter permease ThiP [Paracoccus aestuarii]RJL04921.1 thiamine/thiamine pyrophosphate ABC transporter permease ThiP [Paracoccus aestuarii]WCQ99407.1 thiamine/thiamine pyrophosphate ABC transporter permease ThiP [Paracoccus aestuarii]
MAARLQLGHLVAAFLATAILGTLGAVAWSAGGLGALSEWDWRAVRFTLWQAALSATLSALLAVPVARALARRRFRGRGLLVTLLGAPFILPVIVAIMGLIAVFGRNGAVNEALRALGLPEMVIYGWQGVILAHVFLNLPLSVRLILQGWQAIPAERFRLAASLDFAPCDIARHLERPMLRAVLPGVWLAVFLVCLTSFTVALALGGGPRATTVELAIYQAFRFDFDLGRAASLGLVQIGLCVAAALVARRIVVPAAFGAGLDARHGPPAPGGWRLGADALVITLAAGFLLWPMGAVITTGLPRIPALPADVWDAAWRSVVMAVASALLSVGACLALALTIAAGRARWVEAAGMLPLIASPLVLGTGLFILLRGVASPQQMALPVTVAVNAAMALPFGLRALIPAAQALRADYDRLALSLDLRGLARLRLLTLPRLARPLGFAGGLAAALAMGDLGVITLFASDQPTLPLKLYQLMNGYRMADAAAASVLLMILSFGLFWLFDRGGRLGA